MLLLHFLDTLCWWQLQGNASLPPDSVAGEGRGLESDGVWHVLLCSLHSGYSPARHKPQSVADLQPEQT